MYQLSEEKDQDEEVQEDVEDGYQLEKEEEEEEVMRKEEQEDYEKPECTLTKVAELKQFYIQF